MIVKVDGEAIQPGAEDAGNFVSEWFGHRMYPRVVSTPRAVADQAAERCPFLTQAVGEERPCIKADAAKGVCTISCSSNGPRQDWLVCPYRALSDDLVSHAIRKLYQLTDVDEPFVAPAAALIKQVVRDSIVSHLSNERRVFIYFDKKTSGELSIPATPRSPEFSFDVTIVEVTLENERPHIGRFGILEIQTMDFHGSYREAVRNLREGLRMHRHDFGKSVEANRWWLAEGIEGPNIANVFKRTFYQMMFKFGLGQHERCAGCVLAIPRSVWDSWQRHLGGPNLTLEPDGTFRLAASNHTVPSPCPAWIHIFEPEFDSSVTPSPLRVHQVIGTDARAISHWALEVAPEAALSNIQADTGFLAGLSRRLKGFWPELAQTVVVDISTEDSKSRRASGTRRVRAEDLEKQSSYSGPGNDAVSSDPLDEG